jgi:DNA repair protein RadD
VPDAPGISIRSIIKGAPDSALKDFAGAAAINVLSALNPELVTRDNLIELAYQAADPLEMLRCKELRDRLILLLPLAKANELASKLGLKAKGAALYNKLIVAASDRRSEPTLVSFFGVVLPDRAPGLEESPEKEVQPTYGLFPYQRTVAAPTLAALRAHPHKILVHMPTGAGKTRTAMHIVADIINHYPDRLVVWLAHSSELLDQAADEFEKAWSAIGTTPTKVYHFWGLHEPKISDIRTGFLVAGFGKLHALRANCALGNFHHAHGGHERKRKGRARKKR